MKTGKTSYKLLALTLAALSSNIGGTLYAREWDFRHGDASINEWLQAWELDSAAAKAAGALSIAPQPGLAAGKNDAFILEDVYDSSILSEDDSAGTPSISSTFDSVKAGTLAFRAGTSGTQNQNGMITLLAHGRPLLIVKLVNNSKAIIVSGAGEHEIQDDVNWFNRARDYSITWQGNGHATVSFTSNSGETKQFGPLRLLAPGAPDEIQLQVGYGRATGKALRIETFSLTTSTR